MADDRLLIGVEIDEIWALGDQWIAFGDELTERIYAMNNAIADTAWSGLAGDSMRGLWGRADHMQVTWGPGVSHVPGPATGVVSFLLQARDAAYLIGGAINDYGDQLAETVHEINKQNTIAIILAAVGAVISVILPIGPVGVAFGLADRALTAVISSVITVASRTAGIGAGTAGRVGGFVGGIVSGAALNTGIVLVPEAIVHAAFGDKGWKPRPEEWAPAAGLGAGLGGIIGAAGRGGARGSGGGPVKIDVSVPAVDRGPNISGPKGAAGSDTSVTPHGGDTVSNSHTGDTVTNGTFSDVRFGGTVPHVGNAEAGSAPVSGHPVASDAASTSRLPGNGPAGEGVVPAAMAGGPGAGRVVPGGAGAAGRGGDRAVDGVAGPGQVAPGGPAAAGRGVESAVPAAMAGGPGAGRVLPGGAGAAGRGVESAVPVSGGPGAGRVVPGAAGRGVESAVPATVAGGPGAGRVVPGAAGRGVEGAVPATVPGGPGAGRVVPGGAGAAERAGESVISGSAPRAPGSRPAEGMAGSAKPRVDDAVPSAGAGRTSPRPEGPSRPAGSANGRAESPRGGQGDREEPDGAPSGKPMPGEVIHEPTRAAAGLEKVQGPAAGNPGRGVPVEAAVAGRASAGGGSGPASGAPGSRPVEGAAGLAKPRVDEAVPPAAASRNSPRPEVPGRPVGKMGGSAEGPRGGSGGREELEAAPPGAPAGGRRVHESVRAAAGLGEDPPTGIGARPHGRPTDGAGPAELGGGPGRPHDEHATPAGAKRNGKESGGAGSAGPKEAAGVRRAERPSDGTDGGRGDDAGRPSSAAPEGRADTASPPTGHGAEALAGSPDGAGDHGPHRSDAGAEGTTLAAPAPSKQEAWRDFKNQRDADYEGRIRMQEHFDRLMGGHDLDREVANAAQRFREENEDLPLPEDGSVTKKVTERFRDDLSDWFSESWKNNDRPHRGDAWAEKFTSLRDRLPETFAQISHRYREIKAVESTLDETVASFRGRDPAGGAHLGGEFDGSAFKFDEATGTFVPIREKAVPLGRLRLDVGDEVVAAVDSAWARAGGRPTGEAARKLDLKLGQIEAGLDERVKSVSDRERLIQRAKDSLDVLHSATRSSLRGEPLERLHNEVGAGIRDRYDKLYAEVAKDPDVWFDGAWKAANEHTLDSARLRNQLDYAEFREHALERGRQDLQKAIESRAEYGMEYAGPEGEERLTTEWTKAVETAVEEHWSASFREFRDTDIPVGGWVPEDTVYRGRVEDAWKAWDEPSQRLRATLPDRIAHEIDKSIVLRQAATDFDRIVGHPDDLSGGHILSEESVKKVSGDFRTDTITEFDRLWGQDGKDSKAWLEHEAEHEGVFGATLTGLREAPFRTGGQTPGEHGEGPVAGGSAETRSPDGEVVHAAPVLGEDRPVPAAAPAGRPTPEAEVRSGQSVGTDSVQAYATPVRRGDRLASALASSGRPASATSADRPVPEAGVRSGEPVRADSVTADTEAVVERPTSSSVRSSAPRDVPVERSGARGTEEVSSEPGSEQGLIQRPEPLGKTSPEVVARFGAALTRVGQTAAVRDEAYQTFQTEFEARYPTAATRPAERDVAPVRERFADRWVEAVGDGSEPMTAGVQQQLKAGLDGLPERSTAGDSSNPRQWHEKQFRRALNVEGKRDFGNPDPSWDRRTTLMFHERLDRLQQRYGVERTQLGESATRDEVEHLNKVVAKAAERLHAQTESIGPAFNDFVERSRGMTLDAEHGRASAGDFRLRRWYRQEQEAVALRFSDALEVHGIGARERLEETFDRRLATLQETFRSRLPVSRQFDELLGADESPALTTPAAQRWANERVEELLQEFVQAHPAVEREAPRSGSPAKKNDAPPAQAKTRTAESGPALTPEQQENLAQERLHLIDEQRARIDQALDRAAAAFAATDGHGPLARRFDVPEGAASASVLSAVHDRLSRGFVDAAAEETSARKPSSGDAKDVDRWITDLRTRIERRTDGLIEGLGLALDREAAREVTILKARAMVDEAASTWHTNVLAGNTALRDRLGVQGTVPADVLDLVRDGFAARAGERFDALFDSDGQKTVAGAQLQERLSESLEADQKLLHGWFSGLTARGAMRTEAAQLVWHRLLELGSRHEATPRQIELVWKDFIHGIDGVLTSVLAGVSADPADLTARVWEWEDRLKGLVDGLFEQVTPELSPDDDTARGDLDSGSAPPLVSAAERAHSDLQPVRDEDAEDATGDQDLKAARRLLAAQPRTTYDEVMREAWMLVRRSDRSPSTAGRSPSTADRGGDVSAIDRVRILTAAWIADRGIEHARRDERAKKFVDSLLDAVAPPGPRRGAARPVPVPPREAAAQPETSSLASLRKEAAKARKSLGELPRERRQDVLVAAKKIVEADHGPLSGDVGGHVLHLVAKVLAAQDRPDREADARSLSQRLAGELRKRRPAVENGGDIASPGLRSGAPPVQVTPADDLAWQTSTHSAGPYCVQAAFVLHEVQ